MESRGFSAFLYIVITTLALSGPLVRAEQVDDAEEQIEMSTEVSAEAPSAGPREATSGAGRCTDCEPQPALLARDVEEVVRQLNSPLDRCAPNQSCGFTSIMRELRTTRGEVACRAALDRMIATRSPWRDLDRIEDRASAFIAMARAPAQRSGVDVRTMLCIGARETRLEPLQPKENVCPGGAANFFGLGQIKNELLRNYMNSDVRGFGAFLTMSEIQRARDEWPWMEIRGGRLLFRSANPDLRQMTTSAQALEIMGGQPSLQIELMAFTIWEKGRPRGPDGRINEARALRGYGDGVTYTTAITNCSSCLRGVMTETGEDLPPCTRESARGSRCRPDGASMMSCLNRASPALANNFEALLQRRARYRNAPESAQAREPEPRAERARRKQAVPRPGARR